MNSKIAYIKGVIVTALKYVAETFTLILAAVVNNCLSSNNYSDVLKITRSVPVSKKGDPESLKSSLISVIAKYSKPRWKNKPILKLMAYFQTLTTVSEQKIL